MLRVLKMLRVVVVALRITEVVWLKKKNNNSIPEIVKYRFAGKLN
jgi:hypothetical protein